MLEIDGSFGEGGGQILRTSLSLSLVTGTPFRMGKIRAARARPGLMKQHLTALNAAARICDAEVKGNEIGSKEVEFRPNAVKAGAYRFSVGSAGSATLVLQTVLPALVRGRASSRVTLEGGTHNPQAPPFEFLASTFLPLLNRMGHRVRASLERAGFYPAGGGRFTVVIEPASTPARLALVERGKVHRTSAKAMVSRLPRTIAEREIKILRNQLGWGASCFRIEQIEHASGPGNALLIEVESENVTEVFAGFGRRGVPAEKVASATALEVREYLDSGVPAGRYLADQLLVPLALAGRGVFRTMNPSRHCTTNMEIIKRFLDVEILVTRRPDESCEIRFGEDCNCPGD